MCFEMHWHGTFQWRPGSFFGPFLSDRSDKELDGARRPCVVRPGTSGGRICITSSHRTRCCVRFHEVGSRSVPSAVAPQKASLQSQAARPISHKSIAAMMESESIARLIQDSSQPRVTCVSNLVHRTSAGVDRSPANC